MIDAKKREENALEAAQRLAARELGTGDSLVDYVKILYAMDQESKLAKRLRGEGDDKR
ncbi:hypothetical protein [Streptomyces sp. 3213.3]|uniref:hypothetical protein n=1 Tax=Streptomyces sp. 3213.3 TaxID=1855348 RepID=UPI001356A2A9|nr:hypothetical protein [Streptomyces sp. 3213.3]